MIIHAQHPVSITSRSLSTYHAAVVGVVLFFEPISKALINSIRSFVVVPYHLDLLCLYGICAYLIMKLVIAAATAFPWEEIAGFCCLYLLVLVGILLNGMNASSTGLYTRVLLDLLLASLPYYVLFRFEMSWNSVIKVVGPIAIAAALSMVVNTFLFSWQNDRDYSLYYGYMALTPCVICQLCFFSARGVQSKLIYALSSIVGLLTIASCGARGPFVAAMVFFVGELIAGMQVRGLRRIFYSVAMLLLSFMLFSNFEAIVATLAELPIKFGGSGRFFEKIKTTGSMFTSAGRERLYPTVLSLIGDNFLFGCGVGNDRICIAKAMNSMDIYGYYPHNLFLELMLQFGVPLGCILTAALLYLLYTALRKADPFERRWLFSFFCFGMVPLMLSRSYLDSPLFFAMLSISIGLVRRRKLDEQS